MIPRHPWGGLAAPGLPPPFDVAVLGIPYEGGVAWRGGTSEAPRRLRDISASSPAISEDGFIVDPAALRVCDLGDIAPAAPPPGAGGGSAHRISEAMRDDLFARVEKKAREALRPGAAGRDTFLLSIGGDHSVNIPLLRGFASGHPGGFGLVSLDAHPDLFDRYDDSPLTAGCPMRRALDGGRLKPAHLVILGTRSYNQVEIEFMRDKGILFVPARRIDREGAEATVAMVRDRLAGLGSAYLTLDIDVADPACAPGTGAPVAGGLSGRQLLDLTRGLLQALPVRAMDIVEIAPRLDPTDATLFLALQIVFETFAVLAEKGATRSD